MEAMVVHASLRPRYLETVAEGVETEKVLVALGGDLAQGFPVSRPLPQDKLFLFLNNCEWIVPSADAA